MSQTQRTLAFDDRAITLLGTAHVSSESVAEVSEAIKTLRPDCVAIELDEKRRDSIKNPDAWRNLDIIAALRRKQGFLLLANLALSSFQKRMGKTTGVKPGDEMLAAMNCAEELGIPSEMVDRPVAVTMRRAWAKNSLWGKCKLLATMIASAFDKDEISEEEIESLKNSNEMDSMMRELSSYLPKVKEVLIDERDRYIAAHIWAARGENIVAVIGAGHLPGVQSHLEKIAASQEDTDTRFISAVPEKRGIKKYAGWLIPILIVALVALGFVFGGRATGGKMVGSWVVWNSALAALGSLAAAGHPLTILVGALAAPVTSLCPVIGVGMFTGIAQAFFCKPKVKDMETLQDDAATLKGWYRNRLLRVLLVFVFSTLGSAAGTFIAGAGMVKSFGGFFLKIKDAILRLVGKPTA